MEPRNILYISLSLAALIFAGAIAYAAFRLAQVLKSLKVLIEDIEDTARDVKLLKDKLKTSSFSLIALLLKGWLKKSSKRAIK